MPHTLLADRLRESVSLVARAAANGQSLDQVRESLRRHQLSRRALLQRTAAFGAAVAGTLVFPAPPRAANSRPSARIVIVGAGLAGLTCAYRLRQAGYAARVIEAADYVGGRCKTRRGFFEEGQLIEQGGELIDQSHTAIRQLAQELGLATDNLLQAEAGDTEAGYYFDGGFYSYEEATADIKGIWQKLHRDLVEASYPTTFDRFTPRGWELDHMSIIDWINETVPGGLDSRLGQLLDVAYTIEYGAESSEQSALNLLYLLGFSGQGQLRIFGPSNEKYHVRGGNDQLPARLAEALPDQIQLGSALVAVKRNADGTYSVTLKPRAGRTQTVTADKLVLALPFSILRASVDLTKAGFSALKQTAIREQGMGTNTKLQLQFSDRHWRALGHNGESYADTGYQATWEVSRAQPGQAGILVDYTGGLIGASFNSGTPASRAQQFLAQIEPLLPGLSAKWNGKVTLDYWPGYQWTRGSYSYWKVGQYTRFAGIEGARAGNCFFAGEHTSIDSQGYLNGAVESGGRVAEEILADLRGGSARLAGASAE